MISTLCSIISLVFNNCSRHVSEGVNNWTGGYKYEEEPVKAAVGYAMVMEWQLAIRKENDNCTGSLEINGQQTQAKWDVDIKGDSTEIAIIFKNLIEGPNDRLKAGDTLFVLTKQNKDIKTIWKSTSPRLSENSSECECFFKTDITD